MGFFPTVCKILRKGKCFIVLLLSLSVLAWIAIFSGEPVKSVLVSSATTQTLVKEDSLRNKLTSWTTTSDDLNTPPPKFECPQQSPFLRKYLPKCRLKRRQSYCVCVCVLDLTGLLLLMKILFICYKSHLK